MELVYYAKNIEQCENLVNKGIKEIILSPDKLSRFGTLSLEEAKRMILFLRDHDVYFSIDWDILMTENILEQCLPIVQELIEAGADNFRVKDIGALKYLLDKSESRISFYQGYSNQNIDAIKFWKDFTSDRLDRIILSLEVSKDFISKIKNSDINIKMEVCLLSKTLISYTPRKLISSYVEGSKGQIYINSLEGPNQNFLTMQNEHGTFLFYMHDFSLIDKIDELYNYVDYGAIDLRLLDYSIEANKVDELKQCTLKNTMTGFYEKNETDLVFSKLKNKHLVKAEETFLGEIVDVKKDKYLGIWLKGRNQITKDEQVIIKTPDGKKKKLKISFLKNGQFEDINNCKEEKLVYINYFSGVTNKSLVFLNN